MFPGWPLALALLIGSQVVYFVATVSRKKRSRQKKPHHE